MLEKDVVLSIPCAVIGAQEDRRCADEEQNRLPENGSGKTTGKLVCPAF